MFVSAMRTGLLLLASLVTASASASRCPGGWAEVGHSCYTVSPARLGWHAAQEVAAPCDLSMQVSSVRAVLLGRWRPPGGDTVHTAPLKLRKTE